MDSNKFILINLAIVAFFVLIFYSGRRKKHPTKLNLKKEPWQEGSSSSKMVDISQGNIDEMADHIYVNQIKDLNPRFIYNGHDWDAYEVLGVPAGSNFQVVRQAYHLQISKSGPESREFLETALKTIIK